MGVRRENDVIFLTAAAATGAGTAKISTDFKNATFGVATAGTATLTVKFQGSMQSIKPDFTSAKAVGNVWDYIQTIDLENGNPIDGETGFSVAGADDVKQLAANIDGMRWLNAEVTAYTGGTITVTGYLFSND